MCRIIFVLIFTCIDLGYCFNKEILANANCGANEKVCKFTLNISRKQTMMLYRTDLFPSPLTIRNNTVNKRTGDRCESTKLAGVEDLEDVAIGDGTIQYTYTVNGQFPGPTLVVYEGQSVEVNVTNSLVQEGTTIHWHGMFQKGTYHMDGVPSITQCLIGPEETFTYRFKAEPSGTHWYHSHLGAQRSDGLFGAFIVLPKPRDNADKSVGAENILPTFDKDYLMMTQDWYHPPSNTMFSAFYSGLWRYFQNGYDSTSPCYNITEQVDGALTGPIPYVSGLINGKGFLGDVNLPGLLEQYDVIQGKFYRFRLINPGMMFSFRVSVDQHKLIAFSGDGFEFEAVEVDSIIVSLAERYDFYIKADQPVANYWIRAQTMENLEEKHETRAILHYTTAEKSKPATLARNCTKESPCFVLNCPFRNFPESFNTSCINVGDLRSTSKAQHIDNVDEHMLMFHFAPADDDPTRSRASVNGIQFRTPSPLTQDAGTSKYIHRCDPSSCKQDTCHCTNVLQLQAGRWIQMVLISQSKGGSDNIAIGSAHPIHLHGHHFQVLKVGYPTYDATKRIASMSSDVKCGDDEKLLCRHPIWSDPSWGGVRVPGLNTEKPILKDTVQVPAGGYAVIRFKTDNPGRWIMHCHMEIHHLEGMALLVQEGEDYEIPQTPPYFPTCGSFNNPVARTAKMDHEKVLLISTVCLGIFSALALITIVVLVAYVCKLRRSPYRQGYENLDQPGRNSGCYVEYADGNYYKN